VPPFAARRSSPHPRAAAGHEREGRGREDGARHEGAAAASLPRRAVAFRARAVASPTRARPQVFASIARIDDKQIDATVDKMEQEPADILLKYVYRGLEEPTDNNASLFKWQAKILDKFGIGSVVRVLTDRKTV
jgi:actin related protein 2/3 complex subunit 5